MKEFNKINIKLGKNIAEESDSSLKKSNLENNSSNMIVDSNK